MPSWEEQQLRDTICNFPKHRGDTWYRVCAIDSEYAEWITENIEDLDEDLCEAIKWGVKHVPTEIA